MVSLCTKFVSIAVLFFVVCADGAGASIRTLAILPAHSGSLAAPVDTTAMGIVGVQAISVIFESPVIADGDASLGKMIPQSQSPIFLSGGVVPGDFRWCAIQCC